MLKFFFLPALAAAAFTSAATPSQKRAGVTVGAYYRASIPAAGEDARASWAGGAARLRYEWSETFAITAAFSYDRHEFGKFTLPKHFTVPMERQILSFRGGVIYNIPLRFTYPYAGGGAVLARERTYYQYGYVGPKVLYHPGLYGEAGTYVPLIGPLVVDAGPDLVVLFGKRAAAYNWHTKGYEYDGGAALYFGIKAGLAIFF
ncbi:MAG: hypothetical protein GTN49_11490 [candidate division Zixibacteria bacterium]|nr:hypothetical protein [candidate division Zixibacteria bacterium]